MRDGRPRSSRRHHRWGAVVPAVAGAALLLAGHHLAAGPGAPSAAEPTAGPAGGPASVTTWSEPPAEVRAPSRPGAPRRLRLPSLRVQAPVVPVAAPGGTLVPPRDPDTLGWWAGGVRPGATAGSVLVAGHTVHGATKGALDDLGTLRPGAPVVVDTDRGSVRYLVTSVRVLAKGRLAERAARLFEQRGQPRLVLVTCADWDGHRFLSNVVVLARPTAR